MPGSTVKYQLPYPTPDDIPDGAAQMKALAERVDSVIAPAIVGDLKLSARTSEHSGWIKADGRALSVGQYTALRDVLIADGMPFGNVSGNPKIPDMRGRVPVGAGAGPGLTTRAAGQTGGAETHTLTIAEMPSHRHVGDTTGQTAFLTMSADPAPHGIGSPDGAHPAQIDNESLSLTGGNGGHNNVPPFTVAQWFIFAG